MKAPHTKLLAFFILSFTNLSAQQAFEGYYISLKGDSVKGSFSNYKEWQYNPATIQFNTGSQVIGLKPTDVREVHITGRDVYVSYTGTRLLNPTNLLSNMKQVDSTNRFDTGSYFLRVLFEWNDVKLFLFETVTRSNFYIQKGTVVCELIYKAYTTEDVISYSPLYREQLLVAFEKRVFEKGLLNGLNKLRYNEKDLVTFLQKLTSTSQVKNKLYPGKLIVEAGLSINNIKKLNSIAYPEANASYRTGLSGVLSVGYIFYNQRSFGKLFFSPQLKFYSFKNTGPSKSVSGVPLITTAKSGILLNPVANLGYNVINKQDLKWGMMLNGGIMISPKESLMVKNASGQESDVFYTKKKFKYTFGIQTRILLKNRISGFASFLLPAKFSYFYGPLTNIQIGGGLAF